MNDDIATINGWQPPLITHGSDGDKRIATQADVDWMQRQIKRLTLLAGFVGQAEAVRREIYADKGAVA